MSVVLFDIEGTLVNTDSIAHHRDQRHWNDYRAGIPTTVLYPGVVELLTVLAQRGIPWATVSNITDQAGKPLLKHHGLVPSAMFFYHDAKPHPKPHPKMIHLALNALNASATNAIGVGDTSADSGAFNAAGVLSLCAGWNPKAERNLPWSAVLTHPADVTGRLR